MREARLEGPARSAHKAVEAKRKRRVAAMCSDARFTPSPAKRRYSTRGQRGEPWLTKKHTPSRIKDMSEARHG